METTDAHGWTPQMHADARRFEGQTALVLEQTNSPESLPLLAACSMTINPVGRASWRAGSKPRGERLGVSLALPDRGSWAVTQAVVASGSPFLLSRIEQSANISLVEAAGEAPAAAPEAGALPTDTASLGLAARPSVRWVLLA